MSLFLKVTFESDWHVGTGAGKSGDTDRLIARERVRIGDDYFFEVPVLPAKTITGVLRDAAEMLAFGLDSGESDGRWAGAVTRIFGGSTGEGRRSSGPSAATLSIRPGRLSDDLIRNAEFLQREPDRLSVDRSFVALTVDGVAKAGSLRRIETGLPGLEFFSQVSTPGREIDKVTMAIVVLAAALIEGMGAKRRRGLGRCSVVLVSADGSAAMTVSEAREFVEGIIKNDADLVATLQPERSTTTKDVTSPSGGLRDWRRFTLSIESDTALLVGGTTSGNLVRSSDYIPGRALLPLVCSRLSRLGLDANGLVRAGELLVSNGALVVADKALSPTPLAFSRLKRPEAGVAEVWNTLHGRPPSQSKQIRGGWVAATGGASDNLLHEFTSFQLRTHNVVNDALQRPDESTGGLFSYQAIEAGSRYQATLWLRIDDEATSRVVEAMTGPGAIGQSRKDDYGSVTLRCEESQADERASIPEATPFVVWCTAGTLLRDPVTLAPVASAHALRSALAVALELDDFDLEIVDDLEVMGASRAEGLRGARIRTERIDSFNTRWGLPQPTQVAISAGSVVVLRTRPGSGGIASEQISHVENHGIGERRAEGFGRVIIDADLFASTSFQGVRTASVIGGRRISIGQGSSTGSALSFTNARSVMLDEIDRRCRENSESILGALKIKKDPNAAPSVTRVSKLVDWLSSRSTLGVQQPALIWFEEELRRPTSARRWGDAGPLIGDLLGGRSGAAITIWGLLGWDETALPEEYRVAAVEAALKSTRRHRVATRGRAKKEADRGEN
jgi:CRISPR-associated protein Csx10